MAKPVIMTVDDDREVLRAVQRDLRRHYGRDFRVVGAESGAGALEILRRLAMRNEAVSLLLVDQRMPEMTGVEFLEAAIELFPGAKRALLTAYADTEAAIAAINKVSLDHYILKPWDPPEERLYPVLDDLLDDWRATFTPPFEGVRVVADRWSKRSHEVKEFLARNQIPYQVMDAETDGQARRLLEAAETDGTRLPLVVFPNGTALVQPTNLELADRIGLQTRARLPFYDLIIVGAGPAGLAAAVYGASEGLKTLLVEREAPGGQAGQSARIENYLGFPVGLSGADLTRRAVTQARRFGAEILIPEEATRVDRHDPYRVVTLSDGVELSCQAMLITTGVSYRRLDAPGCEELAGAGVYYGASSIEAVAHKGEDVFVVGGGNSAGQAVLYLSRFASSVTLLVRDESLKASMSQYLIDNLEAAENVRLRYNVALKAANGSGHLEELDLEDRSTGQVESVGAGALFIFVGQSPRTEWVAGLVARDEPGFILSGTDSGPRPVGWTLERSPFPLETSVPGIFVAGDVRFGSIKRVATAVGEGAMAVRFVHDHLASL